MALVIEMGVEPVEAGTFALIQMLVAVGKLRRNAGVEMVRLLRVADKQHLVHQAIKPIPYGLALHVGFTGKEGLNLSLRIELGQQAERSISQVDKVSFNNLPGVFAKEVAEKMATNERLKESVVVEVQPVRLHVVARIGQCRVKGTQQPLYGIQWNLPDTKEPEDMVNTIGIEVVCHLVEPLFPPGVIVPGHLFPIVGGETPVLPQCRKVIGRSSRLTIHIEQVRVDPGIGAMAADANGDIAFEGDSMAVGVTVRIEELPVKMELQEVADPDFVIRCSGLLAQLFNLLDVIRRIALPAAEVGRSKLVTQNAEGRIRH